MQLFKMTIANVAPCLVPLPDNACVAGFGVSLGRLIKGRVPTSRIRVRYLDSALQQKHGGPVAHSTAFTGEVVLPVGSPGSNVHHDNFEWQRLMLDSGQFCPHIGRRHHMAVGKMPEVQYDTWLKAPLQRDCINRYRSLFTPGLLIHGGMKVIRRIKVRAVMRTQLHKLDRPALPIGQLATLQPRKKNAIC